MPVVNFSELKSYKHVSLVWGVAVEDLDAIAKAQDQSVYYAPMDIPKRGRANKGKFRRVHKVEWNVLSQLQKNISRDIDDSVSFHTYVQGFVRKRSAVSNAQLHLGQPFIVHADIRDFFDAIDSNQVRQAFVRLGCADNVADILAKVCTLNGRLPQGASTSPIVSNLICANLDADLNSLASRLELRYSRYGDDLTFSGATPVEADAIRGVVASYGFELREDKLRTQRRGKSQFVTGLCAAEPDGPRVPTRAKRRLRLELYYAKKYGIEDHLARVGSDWSPERMVAYIQGWIDYLNSVPAEKALCQRFRDQLAKL